MYSNDEMMQDIIEYVKKAIDSSEHFWFLVIATCGVVLTIILTIMLVVQYKEIRNIDIENKHKIIDSNNRIDELEKRLSKLEAANSNGIEIYADDNTNCDDDLQSITIDK